MKALARKTSQIDILRKPTPEPILDDLDDDIFEVPPLEHVQLRGYAATTKSRVLNEELTEEIRELMPSRMQLHDSWTLVYSLEQHGASLATVYKTCVPPWDGQPGYVLAVRDKNRSVFGAYCNEGFRISELKRYYGSGECFLWKYNENKRDQEINLLDLSDINDKEAATSEVDAHGIPTSNAPRFQAFPYTGLNDFVVFCTPQFLSMGGGDGHYGLWLDSNLEKGVSHRSLTFGNDPLSNHGTKFDIIAVEVWRVG